jgi:hypothetical protein
MTRFAPVLAGLIGAVALATSAISANAATYHRPAGPVAHPVVKAEPVYGYGHRHHYRHQRHYQPRFFYRGWR